MANETSHGGKGHGEHRAEPSFEGSGPARLNVPWSHPRRAQVLLYPALVEINRLMGGMEKQGEFEWWANMAESGGRPLVVAIRIQVSRF